jgi:NitT/TauT family transport system substrate-binding protein
VVRPEIRTASDLKGRKVATPQLGNTQDVALRAWLKDQELTSDTSGGGDVSIVPQANADTLAAFKAGDIDGAWVPEPWVSRLVQEGNGTVLVDEADLWPDGQFVTTHIVVRTAFLEDHPDVVAAFLRGHLAALDAIETDPAAARTVTNTGIEKLTDKALPTEVIDSAWKNLTFTADPVASSLSKSARDAEQAGLLEPVELEGIYDLEVLNQLLASAGSAEVEGL